MDNVVAARMGILTIMRVCRVDAKTEKRAPVLGSSPEHGNAISASVVLLAL